MRSGLNFDSKQRVKGLVMIRKISFEDIDQVERWDKFVESHPKGTPYHLSGWLKAIEAVYSFIPLLYVWGVNEHEISGIFPFFSVKGFFGGKRCISIPFSDYGGPLCGNKDYESQDFASILREIKNQAKTIEIRCNVSTECDLNALNYYKSHVLEIGEDPAVTRKKFNKKTIQYSIRKAEKNGVVITENNDQAGMEHFFRLNFLTRKKHGVPSQPKKFFEKILEHMILKGKGYILLAVFQSKVIAASLFLRAGNTIHYKYNASDPNYLGKITPNHAITWFAIKKGIEEGYRFFDFGRTSKANKGLMRYKEMWGAECSNLPYFYYPAPKGAASKEESGLLYRVETRIWRYLPDTMAERLGPMVYKRMA